MYTLLLVTTRAGVFGAWIGWRDVPLDGNLNLKLPVLWARVHLNTHDANSIHAFNASSPSSLTILVNLLLPTK